jgi:hypothetical protein
MNIRESLTVLLRHSKPISIGAIVVLLMGALIYQALLISDLNKNVAGLTVTTRVLREIADDHQETLDSHRELLLDDALSGVVDLTTTSFQIIEGNFGVSITSVEPHLSGSRIIGEVVNLSGVSRNNLVFNVTFDGQDEELSIIESIASGWAREFSLYIPDTSPENKYAKIEFEGSNISYYSH